MFHKDLQLQYFLEMKGEFSYEYFKNQKVFKDKTGLLCTFSLS